MVTCDRSAVPHPDGGTCDRPRQVDAAHDGTHMGGCVDCDRIRSRRAVLTTKALHNPDGLSPYEFTRGMSKDDALQFWADAKALGFVSVGHSKRGAKLFALPSYAVKL